MAKALFLFNIVCFALLSEATYDYFQMVQRWPPATCSGKGMNCHAPPPTMFTIYGFWPSNYTNAQHTCGGSRFDPTQIAALRTLLNTYWPDVINGKSQRFWGQEWNAHGTCSEDRLNQSQYFQLILNIRTNPNYDLLTILGEADLGPGEETTSYQAIENAIQAATGKKPALRCNTNEHTDRSQLHEIILCFDQDGVTLVDCTKYGGIICPKRFVWLPRAPLSLAAAFTELKESLTHRFSIVQLLFIFLILCFSIAIIHSKISNGIARDR